MKADGPIAGKPAPTVDRVLPEENAVDWGGAGLLAKAVQWGWSLEPCVRAMALSQASPLPQLMGEHIQVWELACLR